MELLHGIMNLRNGKLLKVLEAIVTHPFGSIMRSILVALYELKADEICVIGHHDCGMSKLNDDAFLEKVKDRGIPEERIDTLKYSGVDFGQWLKGFNSVENSVRDSVKTIKKPSVFSRRYSSTRLNY